MSDGVTFSTSLSRSFRNSVQHLAPGHFIWRTSSVFPSHRIGRSATIPPNPIRFPASRIEPNKAGSIQIRLWMPLCSLQSIKQATGASGRSDSHQNTLRFGILSLHISVPARWRSLDCWSSYQHTRRTLAAFQYSVPPGSPETRLINRMQHRGLSGTHEWATSEDGMGAENENEEMNWLHAGCFKMRNVEMSEGSQLWKADK